MVPADEAVGARPVVHDDRLAERLLEIVRDLARQHVGRAARRKGDDEADRPLRVVLRTRDGRGNGEGGADGENEREGDPAAVQDRQHATSRWLQRFIAVCAFSDSVIPGRGQSPRGLIGLHHPSTVIARLDRAIQ